MTRAPKIQGRYERITKRAADARLPFMEQDESVAPPPVRRVVRHAPPPRPNNEPSEMAKVVFGSLAPSVQPALNWLSTPKGEKVVSTGAVALGTLFVSRLLRP